MPFQLSALTRTAAARVAGATIVTGAEVTAITPDGEITLVQGGSEHRVGAGTVLANIAPSLLVGLISDSRSSGPFTAVSKTADPGLDTRARSAPALPGQPEGAQVKVNLLLSRLPRLRDASVDPAAAFGGTFHINETYSQLDRAFREASAGRIPSPLPWARSSSSGEKFSAGEVMRLCPGRTAVLLGQRTVE